MMVYSIIYVAIRLVSICENVCTCGYVQMHNVQCSTAQPLNLKHFTDSIENFTAIYRKRMIIIYFIITTVEAPRIVRGEREFKLILYCILSFTEFLNQLRA